MKRSLRFVLLLTVALGFVAFLPLYIERTMLRSWLMSPSYTLIEWGWKICSLNDYWADYPHITPERQPALWLAVNLALALVYALAITFVTDQFLARRRGRVK